MIPECCTISQYLDNRAAGDFDAYNNVISTGFNGIDIMLGGGLRPGLYVVGAVPSLGKTTLVHQIADFIASHGTHVVYFSLEMPIQLMVKKSINRLLAQRNNGMPPLESKQQFLANAREYESLVGDKLHLVDGNFHTSAFDITTITTDIAASTDSSPVVIVDYLQLVASDEYDKRLAIDGVVKDLKVLSSTCNAAVIVISSFNRESYDAPATFASFKESGGIEYTADVVYGLQLTVFNEPLFLGPAKSGEKQIRQRAIEEAKAECPRFVELKCLKNRFGGTGDAIQFKYYPDRDYFVEK